MKSQTYYERNVNEPITPSLSNFSLDILYLDGFLKNDMGFTLEGPHWGGGSLNINRSFYKGEGRDFYPSEFLIRGGGKYPPQRIFTKSGILLHRKQDQVVNSSGSIMVNFPRTETGLTYNWGKILPEVQWLSGSPLGIPSAIKSSLFSRLVRNL